MASVDTLSELLIAQLLEDDMRMLTDAREAERLQLTDIPGKAAPQNVESDEDIAFKLFMEEARLNGDAALAQALQQSTDSSAIAGQQLAQKLAAAEKKFVLDAEFARRLQERTDHDDDDDANNLDTLDAERYVGLALVRCQYFY